MLLPVETSMSPVCRTPSMRSFMRLRLRRRVDLPQPDGPMNAVTCRSGMSIEMSKSACLLPYQKEKLAILMKSGLGLPSSVASCSEVEGISFGSDMPSD